MSYSSTILADTPQAYYRLDQTSGTTAVDSSGNGYNATLPSTGIVYSQTGAIIGDTDTSMLFSSTATMALPYTLNPSTWTALSLEFWIKTSSSWQYIVVTTSNTTGITTFYLNGLVYSSGTGDFVGIDTDIYYTGSPLSGNLDEIGLYNYVLTSAQVLNHYLVGVAASLFYASNVAQTLGGLTQADQMATTTGGAETSVSVTAPASGTNLYVELLAQGGSSSGTASLPAPTGKGWSINVQGNTILAGNWWSVFTLAKSGTSKSGASLIVRWSRRTMDGVYYSIGTSTLSSQTFSTSKTSYTTPIMTVNFPWQFVSNETLYLDAFVFNASTAWASDVFTVYISNSATQGVANDGVTTAPAMIATPTGLTCLVGASSFQTGSSIPVKNESFTLADMIDQRSVLTLTGEDANGNISFVPNMPVILSDSIQGKLYDGYLASDQLSKVSADPSILQREHKMTFADHHRDYDKEVNGILGVNTNGTNYLNWSAGDIACDFIDKIEAQNGIWGEYAIEADYSQAAFAQGTLTNCAATSTTSPFTYAPNTSVPPVTTNTGDLELQRAGTQFQFIEQTASDFSSGTLTSMTATSNGLKPTTLSAIRFVAQFPLTVAGVNVTASYIAATNNSKTFTTIGLSSPPLLSADYTPGSISNFCNAEIWSGSMTVASFDTLNYDIWISSTSPSYQAIVNLTFSDGSKLTDYGQEIADDPTVSHEGVYDQNGVSSDLLTDLSKYAKDCWYTRAIPCNLVTGKTITSVNLQIQGGSNGDYTIYIKNCYLGSQLGSPFFSTSASTTQVNPAIITSGSGFGGGTVDVVQVYQPAVSQRFSPAHSISAVGLVQNSTITWIASLPTTGPYTNIVYPPGTTAPTSTATAGTMNIWVSYDNATWLLCTNQGALPGLPPGANVSGLSLYLLEQFAGGSDPTAIPALLNVTITINSAAAQTTSDIVATYGTNAEWNTGSFNGTLASSGNLINGGTYTPNFTTFGNTKRVVGSHVNETTTSSTFTVSDTADTDGVGMVLSMDEVLPITNGSITCNISIADTGTNQWARAGVFYRAANWQGGWIGVPDGTSFALRYMPTMVGYLCYIWYDTVASSFGVVLNALNISGVATQVAWVAQSISSGTTYQLTINYTNERHQIYFSGYSNTVPIIDMSDSTYLGGGGVGLYALGTYGGSGTINFTAEWSNFSVTPLATGSWTSPSINLSSLVSCGYTQICWAEINKNYAPQSTASVFTSLDSGTSWQQCANGAEIPKLTPGTSVSSLLIKVLLYSNPDMTTPSIIGLYARVCGNYGTVSGSRISPAMNLTPVGYVASSNCAYHANIPTNTSVTVQTTQDLSTYHTVGNSGAGEALPYWTNQPSPTQDLFNTATSSNYTNTSKSGGSTATVTYDTTNSRITLVGGSGGLYLYNSISTSDVDLLCDMDESDAGGLTWHNQGDGLNYYELGVYDASSSGGFTNQLRLYKVSSGTRTLLGSASSVTFTRGTFHRIKVKMKSGLINIYWDGSCVQSYLDTSSLGSGQCGLRNDGGTSRYYQLWIQPLGVNLSGQALYTKVTLSTSDPTYMPQLFTLLCCVRGPSIGTGAIVPQLHPVTLPFAAYLSAEMDQITQQSGDAYWYVSKWRQFIFGQRSARQGAFPLQSAIDSAQASGYLLYQPTGAQSVSVTRSADPLRNQQIVTNVYGLVNPPTAVFTADGSTTSWSLGYPVYSTPIILVNGQAATVGLQGVDSGKQFYWQPGSVSISYDSNLPKLPSGTVIDVTYVGQSTVNTVVNNSTAIAAQAAIELNSGNIAEIESALTFAPNGTLSPNGMTSTQATTFAQGLLNRFGFTSPSELVGTTLYQGLVPGTTVPVFIPELGLWNVSLPIVKVTTTAFQSNNGIIYLASVDCTNGASQASWQRVWF